MLNQCLGQEDASVILAYLYLFIYYILYPTVLLPNAYFKVAYNNYQISTKVTKKIQYKNITLPPPNIKTSGVVKTYREAHQNSSIFTNLQKASNDGVRWASRGRQLHSRGVTAEKALLRVHASHASLAGSITKRAS